MYGTGNSAVNALSTIQVSRRGVIRSIRFSADFNIEADAATCILEVSFANTILAGTNDTLGSLAELRCFNNLVTSGMTIGQIHKQDLMAVPVNAGDRLYLNTNVAGTLTFRATVFIDVDE
jgi:hypothetical protein